MLKTFPIEFLRQIFEQELFIEHIKNVNYFGGKNQVSILSFYEQLKSQDEVDRFVETYRDLTEQQNRTGLILNGVLVSPENPTITNLYSSLIVPMSYTCSLRTNIANRDQSLETLNNLINELKGRKKDIAQLDCVDDYERKYAQPFMVGTIGQNDGAPLVKNGDFVGNVENAYQIKQVIRNLYDNYGIDEDDDLTWVYAENSFLLKVAYRNVSINDVVEAIMPDSITLDEQRDIYVQIELDDIYRNNAITKLETDVLIYGDSLFTLHLENGVITSNITENNATILTIRFELENDIDTYVTNYDHFDLTNTKVYAKVYSWSFIEDDGTYEDIIFPPIHTSFEKYKVSLSFDAIRCDEPRNLNGNEYCELTFSGQATLVNASVRLGNDLVKVGVSKNKIVAESDINFASNINYLEPLEMPSGNNADTKISQLVSNNFVSNTHTDAMALSLQYTFICDESVPLLEQLFDYGRYAIQGITIDDISPNMIFKNTEYWSNWGSVKVKDYYGKIIESIDIENTESDTLTLSVTFQLQGENN